MRRFRDDPVIARSVPFLLFITFLVLASGVSSSEAGQGAGASASWLVLARGVVVALALVWFWPAYGELRRPGPAQPLAWLLAVLGGFAVFVVWIGFDQDWAVAARPAGFDPQDAGGVTNWGKAAVRLAGLALVVPVMEELFWRSLVLRWIERHDFLTVAPRQVGARAFLVTTVLFAIEHNRWFAGAIAGVVYNLLYMRSGNLWVPILAHVVTNASLGVWILRTQNWQFW